MKRHPRLLVPFPAILLLTLASMWFPVASQQGRVVELIKDINTFPSGGPPENLARLGNRIFFSASSAAGNELWVSDGTVAGTQIVKDILPGPVDSNPRELTVVGNRIFFVANDSQGGGDVWASDGKENGTQLVYDVVRGRASSYANSLIAVGESLFFLVSTPGSQTSSYALVYRNGTTTSLTRTFFYGWNRAVLNGVLYFSFGVDGLWRSDGTLAGTVQILSSNTTITAIAATRSRLFFTSSWGNGQYLWTSDGTAAGTLPLPLASGEAYVVPALFPIGDTLFFTRSGEVWQTDGTSSGTRLLATQPRLSEVGVTQVGGVVYFGGRDARNNSWELWRTDGTTAGTLLLSATVATGGFSRIGGFVEFKGHLFFLANAFTEMHLWTSDGTVAGTRLFKEVRVEEGSLLPLGDRLFFATERPTQTGQDPSSLWVTDGTGAGMTELLRVALPTASAFDQGLYSSLPNDSPIVSLNGALYTIANTDGDGLWRTDGTADGTAIIKSFPFIGGPFGKINSLIGSSLISTGSRLFFSELVQFEGPLRLWTSDGTVEGTVPLVTWPTNQAGLVELTVLDGRLIALVRASSNTQMGYSLWVSDGTVAGTLEQGPLSDLSGGVWFSQTPFNGKIFFLAGRAQIALWQTDGTRAGTTKVAELSDVGETAGRPVVANGSLWFVLARGKQYELWQSDGTAVGTKAIIAVPPDPNVISPFAFTSLAAVDNTLFFTAYDAKQGEQLWASDGTQAGTHLVATVASPSNLSSMYGVLLFSASDGVSGYELWSSDGTSVGTRMVADIGPGELSSNPTSFVAAQGAVVFIATDGVTGRELRRIAAPADMRLQLTLPPVVGGPPRGTALIPVAYENLGVARAVSLTLSLTLGPGLTYLSDTSGISPTLSGDTLIWALPDARFLTQRSFTVRVATPDIPIGTRIQTDVALRSGGSIAASGRSEVLIARQALLPVVRSLPR